MLVLHTEQQSLHKSDSAVIMEDVVVNFVIFPDLKTEQNIRLTRVGFKLEQRLLAAVLAIVKVVTKLLGSHRHSYNFDYGQRWLALLFH